MSPNASTGTSSQPLWGKNARRHCGISAGVRRMGQFQVGVNADRTADGGAPRSPRSANADRRRQRCARGRDETPATDLSRRRQQPIRLDRNIDLPHLMQISRLDQKIDVTSCDAAPAASANARACGADRRRSLQRHPGRTVWCWLRTRGDFPGDIRNRRTECAECCADFRNDQLLAASLSAIVSALSPAAPPPPTMTARAGSMP